MIGVLRRELRRGAGAVALDRSAEQSGKAAMANVGFWRRVGRSLRLRCPRCGMGRLYRGWFAMNDQCAECGCDFRREPGFYLGSIYFNYGLTALVVTVTFVTAQLQG